MDVPLQIQPLLPGALCAGAGAALCLLGYRQYRFHALTVGVAVCAGLAFLGTRLAGLPALAPLAAALGGLLGYAGHRVFFYGYVAMGGALGGAALGLLAGLLVRHSNLTLVCGAAALAGAVLNMFFARPLTIAWTSLVGSALLTISTALLSPAQPRLAPASLLLFAGATLASVLFQFRTSRDEEAHPAAKTLPEPSRELLRRAA